MRRSRFVKLESISPAALEIVYSLGVMKTAYPPTPNLSTLVSYITAETPDSDGIVRLRFQPSGSAVFERDICNWLRSRGNKVVHVSAVTLGYWGMSVMGPDVSDRT